MAFRFRSLVVSLIPLILLGGVALLLWQGTEPPAGPAVTADDRWIPMDLAKAAAVDQIPGWDVRRGTYRLGAVEGRQVLELLPEPLVEGKVLWTRAMRGGGGVRARMRGDRARRTYPRFSVGLHQERELHLRAFPGERKLELVSCKADLTDEVVLTEIPLPGWDWKPEDWLWLELQILADGAGSRCEGRLWTEGTARPEVPSLTYQTTVPATTVFAALQGAPFALRSIVIDAAETLPGEGRSSR